MDTNQIYKLRDNFSIIGLTGKTGSGCSKFAEIISKEIKFEKNKILREPDKIKMSRKNILFKKKYTICYNYLKRKDTKYQTISYTHSLLFYTLHYLIHKKNINNENELVETLDDLIKENFKISIENKIDEDYKNVEIGRNSIHRIVKKHKKLIEAIKNLNSEINKISEDELGELHKAYFETFVEFAKDFYNLLSENDYYLSSFFVHRLGNKIRATGNPLLEVTLDNRLEDVADTKNIYNMAILINKIIKSWRYKDKNNGCHICIDSLRNSLEIMFFKERYSAFYMIAIHNESRHKKRITNRIKDISINSPNNSKTEIAKKVIELDAIEYDESDFKIGKFYAPDVENCIQKSEIHINNPGKKIPSKTLKLSTDFYSMIEQWVKIKSLISHPGLITPSHEERCMQIAYNNKFNSGCISRQVGAVITDENNSIKSVGWNDVPYGSVSCNLRSLDDLVNNNINELDKSFSEFELGKSNKKYKNGSSFVKNVKKDFSIAIENTKKKGLNHSFCFKSIHNLYENEKNQVHTRSLHAEENAMLQISKFGGQGLKGGILYTSSSPCELCAKKAYQLGIEKIIYIEQYPGISMSHILANGYKQPATKLFTGIIGKAFNKLFEPLLSYKDELSILNSEKLPTIINEDFKDFPEDVVKLLNKNKITNFKELKLILEKQQ